MLLIVGGTILMSDQTKPVAATADTASFLIGIGAVLAEVRLQPPAAAPPVHAVCLHESLAAHHIALHRIASHCIAGDAIGCSLHLL